MKRPVGRAALCTALVMLACAVAQGYKKKPDPEPTTAKLTVKLPSMAPLPETQQSQDKGGLKITVAPASYNVKEESLSSLRPVNPSFKEALLMPHQQTDVFAERSFTPLLKVDPDRLIFQVHISNQMSRVFHGSGIAVQFSVTGKTVAIDPSGYGDLVNAIIPPRGEQTILVLGPRVDSIPDSSTVGLFFYDVVTNTDTAGNVTAKQNFEWYFSYRTQQVEKEVSVPPAQRLWVRR
ncbi:MAG TPA: hypothetical protein VFW31_16685 [Candidatus Angelobacter sp.]|nr:hypothetical protein [Candidatus Angelobacter sp.]